MGNSKRKDSIKMYYYFMLMEWFIYIVTIVASIFIIKYIVKTFRNYESTPKKITSIVSLCATLILGSGLGILFFRVAELSK